MPRARAVLAAAAALMGLVAAEDSEPSPAKTLFNPNMAKAFVALSTITYCASEFPRGVPPGLDKAVEENCNEDQERSWCQPAGFAVEKGTVNFVNEPDLDQLFQIMAIVAKWKRLPSANTLSIPEESGCLVVFRGSIGDTTTGANWIRDYQDHNEPATMWPECKDCEVHSGYTAMWRAIEAKLVKKLGKSGCRAEERSPVYVSGHSLGGGMTYFGMYGLKRLGFDVQVSYSFAAPPVGNAYFTNAFVNMFNRDVPLFHVNFANDGTSAMPRTSIHPPFQVWCPHDSEDCTVCDRAVPDCGVRRFDLDTLVHPAHAPPMRSPHCLFKMAPYGNICHFMGLPAINLFYLGPKAMLDYNDVCVNGGFMSAHRVEQPTDVLV